jgi:hypothetical protein
VKRHVLRLSQGPQQGAVFVIEPQVHRHDHMVPNWYHIKSLSDIGLTKVHGNWGD